MADLDHLVGIPWRERGRAMDGADCYGLVCLAFAERGIVLPAYDDVEPDDAPHVRASIELGRKDWTRVDDARPFDLVLMRERPWHIGLVVRRCLMLHMPEGKSSCIEPYTTGRHARRVEGVYRHHLLT